MRPLEQSLKLVSVSLEESKIFIFMFLFVKKPSKSKNYWRSQKIVIFWIRFEEFLFIVPRIRVYEFLPLEIY